MKKLIFSILSLGFFIACGNEAPASQTATATETTASRTLATAPDSLVIDVDSTGHIQIGSNACTFDNLSQVLTDSLKSIKSATGQLPDTIVLHKKGEVLMGTRGEIMTQIEEVKTALNKQ